MHAMRTVFLCGAVLFFSAGAVNVGAPSGAAYATRVEITQVKGPMRTPHGWGHEFTVEIEFEGDPAKCELEWWEYVSYDGSEWTTPYVLPTPDVAERRWQDHRIINAESSTWQAWERRGRKRVVRVVDRPAIPLGNVRIGDGRDYANLKRRLHIHVCVRGVGADGKVVRRHAWVSQALWEREGVPVGSTLRHGTGPHRQFRLMQAHPVTLRR